MSLYQIDAKMKMSFLILSSGWLLCSSVNQSELNKWDVISILSKLVDARKSPDIWPRIPGLSSQISEREDPILCSDVRNNLFGPMEFSRFVFIQSGPWDISYWKGRPYTLLGKNCHAFFCHLVGSTSHFSIPSGRKKHENLSPMGCILHHRFVSATQGQDPISIVPTRTDEPHLNLQIGYCLPCNA